MQSWPVQDAKARFSELVEASLRHGPQLVTKRGLEAVVVVAAEEWRRLQHAAKPSLKALLLTDDARASTARTPIPRGSATRRQPTPLM